MGDRHQLYRPHTRKTEHKAVSVAPKCCRNSEKVGMSEESGFDGQRGTLKVRGLK